MSSPLQPTGGGPRLSGPTSAGRSLPARRVDAEATERSCRLSERRVAMPSTLERFDTAAAGVPAAPGRGHATRSLRPPSPCEGWTAGDVVEHTDRGRRLGRGPRRRALARRAGRHASSTASTAPCADLRTQGRRPRARATEVADGPFGTMALKQLVSSVVVHDLLVHTWDLARATGGDERLDDGARRPHARVDDAVRRGAARPRLRAEGDPPERTPTRRRAALLPRSAALRRGPQLPAPLDPLVEVRTLDADRRHRAVAGQHDGLVGVRRVDPVVDRPR